MALTHPINRGFRISIPDGVGSNDKWGTLMFNFTEDSASASANTSRVSLSNIKINLWSAGRSYGFQYSGWVKIDGVTVWSASYVPGVMFDVGAYDATMPGASGSTTVSHNADGSKACTLEWYIACRTLLVGTATWCSFSDSGSDTFNLTDFDFSCALSATDADIESTSTLTITKGVPSYYYSLQYIMPAGVGGTRKTGYINAAGEPINSEVLIRKASGSSSETINFALPSAFYSAIPNNDSNMCSIIVKAYASNTSTTPIDYNIVEGYKHENTFYTDAQHTTAITPSASNIYFDRTTNADGSTEDKMYRWDSENQKYVYITSSSRNYFAFRATASEMTSRPLATGALHDINSTTIALTGDDNVLVRYFSTAEVTFTSQARNEASIVSKRINGISVPMSQTVYDYENAERSTYNLVATDSRGYVNETLVVPEVSNMVSYIKLTSNPTASRLSATEDEVYVNFSGNYFTRPSQVMPGEYEGGSFGLVQNTLTLEYRYKQAGGEYGNWVEITPNYYDGHYTASVQIPNLSYRNQYIFEVRVTDCLMSFTTEIAVTRGLPIFDWGANDFNVNGDFSVTDINGGTGNIQADGDLQVDGDIYMGLDQYGDPKPIQDSFPTELPTPNALATNLLGTNFTFDGSTAKNVSVTNLRVRFDELPCSSYVPGNGTSVRQGAFNVTYDASKNYTAFVVAYFGWASGDNVPSTTVINNGTTGRIYCYFSDSNYRDYDGTTPGRLHFENGYLAGGGQRSESTLIRKVYGVRVQADVSVT